MTWSWIRTLCRCLRFDVPHVEPNPIRIVRQAEAVRVLFPIEVASRQSWEQNPARGRLLANREKVREFVAEMCTTQPVMANHAAISSTEEQPQMY
jgi:hypothetical protein